MASARLSCTRIRPLIGWRVGLTAHRRADEQAELLRRRGAAVSGGQGLPHHLRVGDLEVVVHGASMWGADDHIVLTDLERLLFAALAERPAAVVSRRALRQRIWGQQCGDSAIDSAVSRLRRVLQPVRLTVETVHRRGWSLCATEEPCRSPRPARRPRLLTAARPATGGRDAHVPLRRRPEGHVSDR